MPLYGGIASIIFFGSMGLPGLCGFVAEVVRGAGGVQLQPGLAILAAAAVILTAGYILWTVQRVYLGINPAYEDYRDMSLREVAIATPLVVLSVALGVFPSYLLLSWMTPSVTGLVNSLAALGGREELEEFFNVSDRQRRRCPSRPGFLRARSAARRRHRRHAADPSRAGANPPRRTFRGRHLRRAARRRLDVVRDAGRERRRLRRHGRLRPADAVREVRHPRGGAT